MSEPLAAVLTDFERIKRGFVRRHEWVAECIYADSSSHSRTAFYVEAFALPLFVPTDHLYFSYGGRIGGRWEDAGEELVDAVRDALPRLRADATLDGLARQANRPEINLHHTEVHLCVALITGDSGWFDQIAKQINDWSESVHWERPIIDRCAHLSDVVFSSGIESGIAILRQRIPGVLSLPELN